MSTSAVDGKQVLQVMQQYPEQCGLILTKALAGFDKPCKDVVAQATPGATDVQLTGYSVPTEPSADRFELVAAYEGKNGGKDFTLLVPVHVEGPSAAGLCAALCNVPSMIAQAQAAAQPKKS